MAQRWIMAESELDRMDQDESRRENLHEAQLALHQQRSDVARQIAERLGETEEEPQKSIYQVVKKLGIDEALRYVQKTLEVEEAGGIMLPDQSRRRTTGGVFFYLIKTEAPTDIIKHIFPGRRLPPRKEPRIRQDGQSTQVLKPAAPSESPFTWDDRLAALAELSKAEKGEAKNVKVTLIGRPGRVIERGQCIVTTMQQQPNKLPALPKGLPIPTPDQIEPTLFAVYIATKQWKKVADAIKDPEDLLIVEGIQVLDKKLPGTIAVFASNVTTKKLQAAQRQPQQSK